MEEFVKVPEQDVDNDELSPGCNLSASRAVDMRNRAPVDRSSPLKTMIEMRGEYPIASLCFFGLI